MKCWRSGPSPLDRGEARWPTGSSSLRSIPIWPTGCCAYFADVDAIDGGGTAAKACCGAGHRFVGRSLPIAERLGEGGFGTVYLADQEKPIRRRVALKIIKAGMDTRQVLARFEAERRPWR